MLRSISIGLLISILIGGILWGSFVFNRWANYTLYYEGAVAKQIKPLELRIKALEDELEIKKARTGQTQKTEPRIPSDH